MLVPTLLVAVCFASSTVANSVFDKPYYEVEDAENLFQRYVKEYGKKYDRREYFERLQIFKERLQDINMRNEKYPMTLFKINHFADLKPEEMQQYYGFKPSNATVEKVRFPVSSYEAPREFDWRKKGVVSHVKNQGACGSCFIFSAVGNIEGQYAIYHQECLALSEGQALDCLPHGTCEGGFMVDIMNDFSTKAGVEKEDDYPYTPAKQTCHEDDSKAAVKVIKGKELVIRDEDTLLQNLLDIGPLAVALDASDFHSYHGGILEPDQCSDNVDHAVLLVGYGAEQYSHISTPYWIIKNSWGPGWGELGYVRLRRGINACSIGLNYTATATVEYDSGNEDH